MSKDFRETTVGKLLDRFANSGEIGSVETKFETKSLVLFGVVLIVSAAAIFAMKKYIFKS